MVGGYSGDPENQGTVRKLYSYCEYTENYSFSSIYVLGVTMSLQRISNTLGWRSGSGQAAEAAASACWVETPRQR